jgi:hypothetical protein
MRVILSTWHLKYSGGVATMFFLSLVVLLSQGAEGDIWTQERGGNGGGQSIT